MARTIGGMLFFDDSANSNNPYEDGIPATDAN
jgi:hypothetical protein